MYYVIQLKDTVTQETVGQRIYGKIKNKKSSHFILGFLLVNTEKVYATRDGQRTGTSS